MFHRKNSALNLSGPFVGLGFEIFTRMTSDWFLTGFPLLESPMKSTVWHGFTRKLNASGWNGYRTRPQTPSATEVSTRHWSNQDCASSRWTWTIATHSTTGPFRPAKIRPQVWRGCLRSCSRPKTIRKKWVRVIKFSNLIPFPLCEKVKGGCFSLMGIPFRVSYNFQRSRNDAFDFLQSFHELLL